MSTNKIHTTPPKVLLCIGRSFGSGGLTFALELHKTLGIPVFDKNILDQAAGDSNIHKEFFEKADEISSSLMSYAYGSSFPMPNSFFSYSTNYLSNERLFEKQSETIRRIAQEGDAIFIGRCSDFILREYPECLSVFITDELEVRVKTVMERLHIADEEEATALIEKHDKQRREFYNYYTAGHWGRADNYDVCIKLSSFGMKNAVNMIADRVRPTTIEK